MPRHRRNSVVVASAALLGLALAPIAPAQVEFSGFRSLPASPATTDVVSADFDGDGRLDLAVSETFSESVAIYRSDCSVDFVQTGRLHAGPRPDSIAVGDWNEDAHADLAVVLTFDDSVAIFLGDGVGSFSAVARVPGVGGVPLGIDTADFDSDGHADLAVANGTRPSVSVLFGDGAGGFETRELPMEGAAIGIRSVAAADFNGDGSPDIAAGGVGTAFLDNRGDRRFLAVAVDVESVVSIAAGDVTGDGRADVVSGRDNLTPANVFHLDGARGFAKTVVGVSPLETPHAFTLGDANGDGRTDIVFAEAARGDRIAVMLNLGSGRFGTSRFAVVGKSLSSIAAWDFDGDGRLDVAVSGGGFVTILHGDGSGDFRERVSALADSRFRYGPVTLIDLDVDSHLDLVCGFSGSVFEALGDGTGAFADPVTISTAPVPSAIRDFDSFDIEPDGDDDLAVGTDGNDVLVLRTVPGVRPTFVGAFDVGRSPEAIEGGDLDLDGDGDLATANSNGGDVSVSLGDGTGAFSAPVRHAVGHGPSAVAIGLVDLDPLPDVVAASRTNADISVLLGAGGGAFGSPLHVPVGGLPVAITLGDVNGDGKTDVVVANSNSSGIAVLLGNGLAAFSAPFRFATGYMAEDVALEDLDHDGRLDVVVTHSFGYEASILLGDGEGGFGFETQYRFPDNPGDFALGDVREDGETDLAVATGVGACVLVNRAAETFAARRGTVNTGIGSAADVVFVNGSAGAGSERRIVIGRFDPFELRVSGPPAAPEGPAAFFLGVWIGSPVASSIRILPRSIGNVGFPLPLAAGCRTTPRVAVNNLGFESRLDRERWPGPPTRPAPTVLAIRPGGVKRTGTLYLQGIMADPGSASPTRLSVTNGVLLTVF